MMNKNNNTNKNKKTIGKEVRKSVGVFGRILSYLLNIFLTILLIGIITGVIVGCVFAYYIFNYVDGSVDDILSTAMNQDLTTKIYYMDYSENDDGIPVELEDQRLHGDENRLWCSYQNMLQTDENGNEKRYLVDAFVSIEDERFWSHEGVDWTRSFEAAVNFFIPIKNRFGASTITQQLIKNITGDDDQTIQRKVQEILRALNLEKSMDKTEIIEMYLNTIFLSQGCYGVQTAVYTYFGKEISDLTLVECAALAAIPKAPTKYDPYRHPDYNAFRRNAVLAKMLELGVINETEYNEAYSFFPLDENGSPIYDESCDKLVLNMQSKLEDSGTNSWFTDQVITDVANALMEEKGISELLAYQMVYSGGLHIYTTLDPEVQQALDEVYCDESYFPETEGAIKPESAMVIINPYNGYVVGIAGGRGEKSTNRLWNYATMSTRSPGSSIKPISVYAPALEEGLITYGSVYDDVPQLFTPIYEEDNETIKDYKVWPPNYPAGFRGLTTVNDAVTRSVNTIAVSILDELSIEDSFNFLKDELMITSLVDSQTLTGGKVVSDKNISPLALGGMTYGVTVEEITAAYSIFVNGGTYYKPRTFIRVEDSNGNIIIDNSIKDEDITYPISEQTATIMTKMLENVVTKGTGRAATLREQIDVAGKTGTTNDDYDRWFVGYTPYYVGGVWFGYDMPQVLGSFSVNPPVYLWNAVMTKVHQKYIDAAANGEEIKEFEDAYGVVEATYCKYSGKLMTDACRLDPRGNAEETGWFTSDTVPTEPCDRHVVIDYDMSTNGVASEYCPQEHVVQVSLVRVDRNFPKQVTVTDAEYSYMDLPSDVRPGGWWGEPFYHNVIPDDVYVGASNVNRWFNCFCYEHYDFSKFERMYSQNYAVNFKEALEDQAAQKKDNPLIIEEGIRSSG